MSRLPTLLAVPGLGLGPEAWAPTLDHLGQGRVRSLPGFGEPAPGSEDLTPAALATRVVAELDEHDDRGVVLLGHSASSQVAAWVAAAAPERVAALVLVGPTTDPRATSWRRLVARWLATALHETPRQVPSLVRQYARTGLPVMARAMEAARHDDISEPLARAAVPMLVVRGRHDAICPADWADRVAALGGRGSRAVTLPAGGHMVPLTHGRLLADAVAGFLSDPGPPPSHPFRDR